MEGEEARLFDISELGKKGNSYGYMRSVDLGYGRDTKAFTSDIPLVSERGMLQEQKLPRLHRDIYLNSFSTAEMPQGVSHIYASQNDKYNVLLHEKTLLFYLEMGMTLKRIHFLISFRQQPWLSLPVKNAWK